MKKAFAAALVIASLSSCHYGQEEAKKTLERNDQYKNEKADFSVNRAGEYAKEENTTKADTLTATVSDTSAIVTEQHGH